MEEDIKILKSVVRPTLCAGFERQTKILKAKENILNRLEQLEKENKELKNNNKIIEVNALQVIETNKYLKENSIPKSVIRDKIDFYKRYGKIKDSDEYVMSVEIDILEEILGDE